MTKLDRDPGSGTALQEITFWLNLERALLKLFEKRESPEVVLTLDVLKHGKRFLATVSFDTDTGGTSLAYCHYSDKTRPIKNFKRVHDLIKPAVWSRASSPNLYESSLAGGLWGRA